MIKLHRYQIEFHPDAKDKQRPGDNHGKELYVNPQYITDMERHNLRTNGVDMPPFTYVTVLGNPEDNVYKVLENPIEITAAIHNWRYAYRGTP